MGPNAEAQINGNFAHVTRGCGHGELGGYGRGPGPISGGEFAVGQARNTGTVREGGGVSSLYAV